MTTSVAVERLREQVEEILEQHGAERAAIDLAAYRGRPVEFSREVLRFEPYPTQCDVLTAPLAHKYTAVRGNHAAGKDAVFACVLLYQAFVEGKLCLATSATERQLLNQLWVEVRRRFAASNLPGVLLASSLEIAGVKRILTMTSGSVSNLTGFHDPAGTCTVISEGQGESVEATAYDSAISNAVDDRCVVLAGGNPIKPEGRFYEIHQKSHWHKIGFSALTHPNVIEGRDVIPGGPTRQWIAEVEAEYGRDSAYYVARVLGEFPTEGSIDQLVTRTDIDRAFEAHRSGKFLVGNVAWRRIVADLARGGPDQSCVAIVQGAHVESLTTYSEPDLMANARRLDAKGLELGRWHTGLAHPTDDATRQCQAHITVDDSGLGGGVTDRLRELGARVRPFVGGSLPRDRKRYANKRAEAYMELRDRLKRGTIALPPDEKLAEELLNTSYSLTDKGKILIEPKDEIKKRIGRSPDRADTCSMIFDVGNTVYACEFYVSF